MAVDLAPAEVGGFAVDGTALLVCRIGADVFAFADRCAGCASSMAGAGSSAGPASRRARVSCACPRCRTHYDVTAGRCAPSTPMGRTCSRSRCWSATAVLSVALPQPTSGRPSRRWPGERTGARLAVCGGSRAAAPRRSTTASGARCAPSRSREPHQHVVNLDSRALMCTCRGCYLLFTSDGAALALPRRARPLPVVPGLPPRRRRSGTALEIPVGAGLLLPSSVPAGPWRSTPAPPAPPSPSCRSAAWEPVVGRQPAARHAAARRRGADRAGARGRARTGEAHLVPIDACYELVGLLRQALARVRRRPGRRGRASRRSSRVGRAPGRDRAAQGAAMSDLAFSLARHRPRAVRRVAAPDRPAAHRGRAAATRCTRSRCAPRCGIEPQRRPYSGRRGRRPDRPVRLPRAVGQHAAAVPVDAVQHRGPGLHRLDATSTCRCRAPTTSRSPRPGTCTPCADGGVPLRAAVQRHGLHPRPDRLRRRAGALGPRGPLPSCRSASGGS